MLKLIIEFILVDKINGGFGAARNSGIKYLIDSNINPKYIYKINLTKRL